MIYAVNHDNGSGSQIQVGNYLKDDVVVYDGVRYRNVIGCYDEIPAKIEFAGLALSVGINPIDLYSMREKCTIYVPFNKTLWFRVAGYWYPFEVIQNKPQIMIISREEAQDQIQIYTDEIVKEDPGDLEDNMKGSCIGLTGWNDGCYNSNDIKVDYCENLAVTCKDFSNLGCRVKCEYYDGKEDDCRSLEHCGWDPIGKSGRGWCKCSGVVAPVCTTDSNGDGINDCGGSCGGCVGDSCTIDSDGNSNCASGLTCKTEVVNRVEVLKCK